MTAAALVLAYDVMPLDAPELRLAREKRTFSRVRPEPVTFSRPQTRADCLHGGPWAARPCPWCSCRHHLLLDALAAARERGERRPALEDLHETCSLDVIDDHGALLPDEIGEVMSMTGQRATAIVVEALASFALTAALDLENLSDLKDLHAEAATRWVGTPMAEMGEGKCLSYPSRGEVVAGEEKVFGRAARRRAL